MVEDQENRSRLPGGVYYWEGAVSVRDPHGNLLGRGYVELTGYGKGNRPPV
jgi:predicted secreted hydrolase